MLHVLGLGWTHGVKSSEAFRDLVAELLGFMDMTLARVSLVSYVIGYYCLIDLR